MKDLLVVCDFLRGDESIQHYWNELHKAIIIEDENNKTFFLDLKDKEIIELCN